MLRIVGVVVALLVVSSTSSAHELRPLIVAPRHATAIISPLVVVELPFGASRFEVLSAIARPPVRVLGGVFRANRIVVLRTRHTVRARRQVLRLRSRGRTILLRRW